MKLNETGRKDGQRVTAAESREQGLEEKRRRQR